MKTTPKITQISYSRLNNLGNYENERIEVTASVGEKQSANAVLEYLEGWVSRQLLLRSRRTKRTRE